MMPIDQVERMYVVGGTAFDHLNEVKRKYYPGTNRGNFLGPLKAPDWDDERETWQLTPPNKKKVLGKNGIHLAGGPVVAGVAAEKYKYKSKNGNISEPVFFHERPINFNDEIVHSYNLGGVIDLTPGSGSLAYACLKKSPPLSYVGVTLSDEHTKQLTERLESLVFKGMHDSKCTDLFEPMLSDAISECTKSGDAAEPGDDEEPKTDAKGKSKAKSKAKGKAKAAAKSSGSGGDNEDLMSKLQELQAQAKRGKRKRDTDDVDGAEGAGGDDDGDEDAMDEDAS